MGVDLGEYDVGGSLAHPVTGEAPSDDCPGGVCNVPKVPPFRAQVDAVAASVASRMVPGWVYVLAFILGGLGVALLVLKLWRVIFPKPAPASVATLRAVL